MHRQGLNEFDDEIKVCYWENSRIKSNIFSRASRMIAFQLVFIRFACKKLPECIHNSVFNHTKVSPNYMQVDNKFADTRNDIAYGNEPRRSPNNNDIGAFDKSTSKELRSMHNL